MLSSKIELPEFHFLGEALFLKSCLNEKHQIRQHNWRRKIHSLKQNVLFIEDCQSDEFRACDGLLSAEMSNHFVNIVRKLRYFVRIKKHFVHIHGFVIEKVITAFFFSDVLLFLHLVTVHGNSCLSPQKNEWKPCVIEDTNCSFLLL